LRTLGRASCEGDGAEQADTNEAKDQVAHRVSP
jgi:hypothetical protein